MCEPCEELPPAEKGVADILANSIATMGLRLASLIVDTAARKAAADGSEPADATEYWVCSKCGILTETCASFAARIQFALCGNCADGRMFPVKALCERAAAADDLLAASRAAHVRLLDEGLNAEDDIWPILEGAITRADGTTFPPRPRTSAPGS